MARYVPDYTRQDDSYRPAKRPRTDNRNPQDDSDSNYRRRSPPAGRDRDSRPRSHTDWAPRRSYDSYVPSNDQDRKRQRSASPRRHDADERKPKPKNKKSTKERKENPSTRIHSLRKQLDRGRLPANIQQERERELASLLFDQQKAKIKQDGKKNLKRYHFIRFVERQKATRTVNKLKKSKETGDVSEDLESQIHEAEVDLNYTLYAPLAQKYIAIYAREDSAEGRVQPLARNLSRMPKKDYAVLSNEQKDEIERMSMESANMLHAPGNSQGQKPPMWYVVEAAMKEGQEALDRLRDEQPKVDHLNAELVVGMGAKKAPDWLVEDGMIDPEDLDSDSEDNEGGVAVGAAGGDEDEEMSDGDGGFFEKR